jgi:hypothetical protein
MNKQCKLEYLTDANKVKYLPWQYYNLFGFVTIPMVEKRPFLPRWNKITKTVHPGYTGFDIGILTGKVNDIVVLDIDEKDNGVKHWKEISKFYSPIMTPTVTSPSGIHLYFKYSADLKTINRIKVGSEKIGWDVRSDNSLIVAPPSQSKENRKYTWVKGLSLNDVTIKSMPIWLKNYILDHKK